MQLDVIPELFGIEGRCGIVPLDAGHINSTYKVSTADGEYILQSLNRRIFRDPAAVMANIAEVRRAFLTSGGNDLAVPEYLCSGGRNYAEHNGEIWRMYRYTEPDTAADSDRISGYAFGSFIRRVSGAEFRPVIEGYHNFGWYFSRLRAIAPGRISSDTMARLSALSSVLDSVFTPDIPKRNIHGDAKTDNVITGRIPTVIDLDTVMCGYAAIDYGDMIRSLSTGGEPDINRIRSATSGFAEGLFGFLTDTEADTLYFGILWTTGELAVRYLTDSISDEKYFRGKTEKQCRDRAGELLRQLSIYESFSGEIKDIINNSFR